LKRRRLLAGYQRRDKALAGALVALLILAIASYGGGVWRGDWQSGEWDLAASQLEGQGRIYDPVVLDGTIYAGTYPNAMLFSYTPGVSTGWTKAADSWGSAGVQALVVLGDTIYGGTTTGHLLAYTPGVDTGWRTLANPVNGQQIMTMVALGNTIYAGTKTAGQLFAYTPGESTGWEVLANQTASQIVIHDLVVVDGTIYAGTSLDGMLFSYTPGTSTGWEVEANQYSSEAAVYGLVEVGGTIYGATTNGYLLSFQPGVSTGWSLECDRLTPYNKMWDLVEVDGTIYAASRDDGVVLNYTVGESTGWGLFLAQYGSDVSYGLLHYGNTLWMTTQSNGLLLSYEFPPQAAPDTGGEALSIGGFWVSPSQPRAGDTVAFKVSGSGITRARVTITVNDPFNGVNTTSHFMSLTGDTWWHKETYLHPCSVVATARVWGADGSSLNSTTLSFSVLPEEDEEPETPVEAVAEVVEEVSQVVEDWMISSIDVAGYEIPLWLPSLILVVLAAEIWRRRL